MSALETIVRVSPEKQTLILAGEMIPRRPLTIVATPVEEPMLLVRESDEPAGSALTLRTRNPSASANPADAYIRTQALSSHRARTRLVDLYA